MDSVVDFEKAFLKQDVPDFRVGDTIKVSYKITEGGKERIQSLDGVVIERKGSGIRETFTLRKISNGVGVERTFPLHSPKIEKIAVLKKGIVHKAKLFYLRDKIGKKAKVKEKKG
jgi:large subunit ribosomal protein L19